MNKCKETYKQKCQELEKLKRDGSSPKGIHCKFIFTTILVYFSPPRRIFHYITTDLTEIEKAESKYRRAHEEYKSSVSTYGNAREDFERKMTLATKRFQVMIHTVNLLNRSIQMFSCKELKILWNVFHYKITGY